MLQESFDAYSKTYDEEFSYSFIGREQRTQVYIHLNKLLPSIHTILEVNCGTGEDAGYFRLKGKNVMASDISREMINAARKKEMNTGVEFSVLNAVDIDQIPGHFDLIFSNFGGLNCLTPSELITFSVKAKNKLENGGKLVLVFISSDSWIERLYFILKKKNKRRIEGKGVLTTIGREQFYTYYYSPDYIMEVFSKDFKLLQLKPIGFFIPPSYFENKYAKFKIVFRLLAKLDRLFTNISILSNKADHFYISFEKR